MPPAKVGQTSVAAGREVNSEHIYHPNTTTSYPGSLTFNDHWSIMELAWSDPKQKFSKIPIDIRTGLPANSEGMNVPFSVATKHLGVNSVLSYYHPENSLLRLGLIDCDNCVAPDGSISPLVQNMLRYLDMYAEFSVTNGVHALCWLDDVPAEGHKDPEWHVEFYWQPRSIPITGNRVVLADWGSPHDIEDGTAKFLKLHKSRFKQAWLPPAPLPTTEPSSGLSQEEILFKLFSEAQGKKWTDIYAGDWQAHYGSPSDADLALLMKFAYYSGRDRQKMEAMFSECPLSKIKVRGTADKPTVWRTPKWVSQKYRKRSLDTAITRTTTVYTPRPKAMSAQELYRVGRQRIDEARKQK